MDLGAVRRHLALQDGVVSRRQLMAGGCTPADLERMLRRRELSRLLPGVFVDHTGVPTWNQRAWAGVLFYRPAALVGDSAVRAASAPAFERHPSKAVHIGIDSDRRLVPVPGYTVTRLSRFDDRVLTNTSPPRQRLEDALLDLAGGHDDALAAVQLLADAVRARLTTAARLRSALAARPRQSRRTWIGAVLVDLDEGTCSVLERGYLVHVERAHGLPRGSRQVVDPTAGGRYVRDVTYARYGMTVELNGRMFHDGSADWDRDLERELAAAVAGGLGLRLGWGQVFARACRLSAVGATCYVRRGYRKVRSVLGADSVSTRPSRPRRLGRGACSTSSRDGVRATRGRLRSDLRT